MSKQFDKQFKENATQYYFSHKELGLRKCAENLGISRNAPRNWGSVASENSGEIPTRGSGNYASDKAKENAMTTVPLLTNASMTLDGISQEKSAVGYCR